MKLIEKKNGSVIFQVKIKNKYVTVATLQNWLTSIKKYNLYFSYYGDEYNAGTYACNHFNGNVSFTIVEREDETYYEMLERVSNIVKKKLYQIADGILTDIKEPDLCVDDSGKEVKYYKKYRIKS